MPADSILLLSMPFGALDRPALGASILQAQLARAGIRCELRYLCFDFAEAIGWRDYTWLQSEMPYTALAGDFCFARAAFGPDPERDARYADRVLRRTWGLEHAAVQRLMAVRAAVEPFLARCLAAIDFGAFVAVGFTSTFEQNLASLALARRVKERWPRVPILIGGANWEGEMGLALHEALPFVDYAFTGEAEHSLPILARSLIESRGAVPRIPGVVAREAGRSVSGGPPRRAEQLDALPIPDYRDYFARLDLSPLGLDITPTLLLETARGCWWGARSHCTFCGLNGEGMAFRSKSAARVRDELTQLMAVGRTDQVSVVDNILDMRYFDDLLPALAEHGPRARLFWEIKANLRREQVALLARAGVRRVQPGIESLSDGVLRRMGKGTTGLRNVQLLKWCRELDIEVDWNILYGFPGETAAERAQELACLRAIHHLEPPGAVGPIRLDRFSPYFRDPERHGLRNIRPLEAYGLLYPFDPPRLARSAYSFEFDYAREVDPKDAAAPVLAFVKQWRASPEHGTLTATPQPGGALEIEDTRAGYGPARYVLAGRDRAVYEALDAVRAVDAVAAELGIPERALRRFLVGLERAGLVATDGRHYLALALRARAAHPDARRALLSREVALAP